MTRISKSNRNKYQRFNGLQSVFIFSLIIWLFISALFLYWYGIENRAIIFLYNHLGLSPFDDLTRSRYFMSGLVASGLVLILYVGANWLATRLTAIFNKTYQPPNWWRIWLVCCLPVSFSVLVITLNVNQPVLLLADALACNATTLVGLGMALRLGAIATKKLSELLWLLTAGLGLMPVLLLFRVIEQPEQRLITFEQAYFIVFASIAGAITWLSIILLMRWRLKKTIFSIRALIISGTSLSYVLLPTFHYLFLVPAEYRYITTAGNFFASSWSTQIISLSVAVGIVAGVYYLLSTIFHRHSQRENKTWPNSTT